MEGLDMNPNVTADKLMIGISFASPFDDGLPVSKKSVGMRMDITYMGEGRIS
jgi:hypothetical protein